MRVSLRTMMTSVAACAVTLDLTRSAWGVVFLVAGLIGLVFGGLGVAVNVALLRVSSFATNRSQYGSASPWDEPRVCAWVWKRTATRVLNGLRAAPGRLKLGLAWGGVTACSFAGIAWMTSGFAHAADDLGPTRWPLILVACIALGVALTWLAVRIVPRFWLSRVRAFVTHHRYTAALRDRCRAGSTWVLVTSPPWTRILLAWTLAALCLPFAYVVMLWMTVWGLSVIDTESSTACFFDVLAALLSACLVVLVRGHYEQSRLYFSRPAALGWGLILTGAHSLVYYGAATVVLVLVTLYSI